MQIQKQIPMETITSYRKLRLGHTNMISEESKRVLTDHLRLIFISVSLGQFLIETN
jgi:hypothetical protein